MQDKIGSASRVDRSDACETPVQSDRADEGGAGDLIVVDVVDLQAAGLAVSQQQIGFARHTAEIADARELPIETDQFELLRSEAQKLGIAVESLDMRKPKDVDAAFDKALAFGAKGLVNAVDTFINSRRFALAAGASMSALCGKAN